MIFDFIKKTLSGAITAPTSSRKLETPDDLQIGDIITFRFLPQAALSGKSFQVHAINTADFKQGRFTVFMLQGESNQPLYLTECVNGEESYLSLRQKVNRAIVDKVFGLEQFSSIFEEGYGEALKAVAAPEQLEGWLAEEYYKSIDCRKGYRHEGDYRNRVLPRYEDESEGFDYYLLLDKSEAFGVEVEVYNEGESDVYIALYQPLSIIESMWPGR
jgi:hypothetical protein